MNRVHRLSAASLMVLTSVSFACGDHANRAASSATGAGTPTAVTTSSSQPAPKASASTSASSAPVPTSFTLSFKCMDEGVVLHQGETSLEMPSGKVVTREGSVVTGELTATAADVAPVLSALADPNFEELMSATYGGELRGEGTQCTVTLTANGHTRSQTWTNADKLSPTAQAGQAKLDGALGQLSTKARATHYGGPCNTDSDCHVAPGPDCHCVAAGPPASAGSVGKCYVSPCKASDKARCEIDNHHCVLAAP